MKDGDLEDYAWQDGDEMWIPWKPQEGEDRFLVAIYYMTPNKLRFYMPDCLLTVKSIECRLFMTGCKLTMCGTMYQMMPLSTL